MKKFLFLVVSCALCASLGFLGIERARSSDQPNLVHIETGNDFLSACAPIENGSPTFPTSDSVAFARHQLEEGWKEGWCAGFLNGSAWGAIQERETVSMQINSLVYGMPQNVKDAARSAIDGSTICIPENTPPIQLLRVVNGHLRANPDKLHLPIGELTHAAFYNAWVCSKTELKRNESLNPPSH
jgi:hypothetical protein